MAFDAYIAQELTVFAERLSAAAARELETVTTHLNASFKTTIDTLRNDQAQLIAENERLTAENTALAWGKQVIVDRLLSAFIRIAHAATVDDVFDAMVSSLSDDFSRIAVFVARDNHFEARC